MPVIQSLCLKVSHEDLDLCLEQLKGESHRYRTTRAIIDRSLQLLERRDMREWLALTAQETVISLRENELECLWPVEQNGGDPSLPEISSFIDFFLKELRRDFVKIRLTRNMRGEAAFVRDQWAAEQVSPTVYSWTSRCLGYMMLSSDIINCMVATKNLTTHRSFMFQMMVSVTHEIGHMMTSVLTGGKLYSTPEKMKTGNCKGEVGFLLEMRAFGGIAEFYADPSRPEDTQQPGIPYLIKGTVKNCLGVELGEGIIQEFVEDVNNVSLPLIPEDISSLPGVTTREDITRNTAGPVMELRSNNAEVPRTRDRYIAELREESPSPSPSPRRTEPESSKQH
ncbi:hypothetical protein GGR55DRAFT_683868 [Xylaria sp. FL0064]|nr:hypothetical protein GGR55DRAFT_683868 [Xylaria sp. FL0064]